MSHKKMTYTTVNGIKRGFIMVFSAIPEAVKNLLTPVAIVVSLGYTGHQYLSSSVKQSVDEKTAQITLNVQSALGPKFDARLDKIDNKLEKLGDKLDYFISSQVPRARTIAQTPLE